MVEYNYFDRCNGELEIISSKTGENVYRGNTFVECEGTLSLRHGNRCVVEGNYFLGNGKPNTGGMRIMGEEHPIYNNCFANPTGSGSAGRSALTLMQELENSPLNGYFQLKKGSGRVQYFRQLPA